MPAALDALIVGLYVAIDDFLGPRHRGPGRPPKLTDAELITLAVAQVLLGMPNDRQFLALARWRLGHLFPRLIDQSGYNRRLRGLAPQIGRCISYLAYISPSVCDRLRLLDSTPVPCGQSRETARRSEFAGYAGYGYCRSHSRWFWGFRLYMITSGDGMPIGWELAAANIGERVVAAEMLERIPLAGHTVIADKNFSGTEFEQLMAQAGARFLRPDRKDESRRHGSLGQSANGSNRHFGPARANSDSNTTAPAPSPASAPASACDCSLSPPASGTTTSPADPPEPSPPTAADYASTI